MKKSFLFVFALIMFVVCTSFPVSAEKNVWVDKNFNFTNVKIISMPIVSFNRDINPVSQRNINEFTDENFSVEKAKIYSAVDIYNSMLKKGYPASNDIRKDPNFTLLFTKEMSQICDLSVAIDVVAYGFDTEYREAKSIAYQTTNSTSVTNTSGKVIGYVNTPQTNYINIPGGNVNVACAYVNISVFDTKTGNIVYQKQDFRRRANETALNNTPPKDLYQRILKELTKDLKKLIAGKKL